MSLIVKKGLIGITLDPQGVEVGRRLQNYLFFSMIGSATSLTSLVGEDLTD